MKQDGKRSKRERGFQTTKERRIARKMKWLEPSRTLYLVFLLPAKKSTGIIILFECLGVICAPYERWKKRLQLSWLLTCVHKVEELGPYLINLLEEVNRGIRTHLFDVLQAGPTQREERKISRFFQNLVRSIASGFLGNKPRYLSPGSRYLIKRRVNLFVGELSLMILEVKARRKRQEEFVCPEDREDKKDD